MTAEGTVPTVGTRAYIDTELSFEKDPAELGDQALWMLIHTKQILEFSPISVLLNHILVYIITTS